MKKSLYLSLSLAVALALSGCGDDSDYNFAASQAEAESNYASQVSLAPLFDPSKGILPSTTNDLLFAGSTDGTLNLPTANVSAGEKVLRETLNALDGFGLTTPIVVNFSNTLKASSVKLGSTVHVFEVSKSQAGAVTGVTREVPASEMVATVTTSGTSIALVPLKPLKESTSYMVVVTNSVTDVNGKAAVSPSAYLLAKASTALSGDYASLEPVRLLVNTQEAAAVTQGIAKNRIVMSWSFTTQSVTPVLQAAAAKAGTSLVQISPESVGTTKLASSSLQGKANLHPGVVELPYYLDAGAALTGHWKGAEGSVLTRLNPTPVETRKQIVPVLLTVPNGNSAAGATAPDAGWPVVIFQHGITRSRLDVLPLADALADAGFAVIAMDLPLHGVTDTTNPFYAKTFERTFNLDERNNTTGATGEDGVIDASGAHFINLQSLLTSRDNLRQGIVDLITLRKSLSAITAVKLDTSKVGFVGISLGGMVGTGYLSLEGTLTPASLAVPGGGIARLLDASETFGPSIRAGLAQAGVQSGTAAYDSFMLVTQTVMDAADPIVLGAKAAAAHPIHLTEVVGLNGVGSDKVIPNSVSGAPLSGTEPLIRIMGLKAVTQTTTGSGAVRFIAGEHGSLLDPGKDSVNLATTIEMQTQTAAFQKTRGQSIVITNPAVISTSAQ